MARQPTTRLQVSGYRFLVRRMEHALVRRDVRMIHDPMRSQSSSLMVGIVLATVVVAGCAILGFFRPNMPLGDQPIVMGKDTGAVYVRIQDTLHPALNLASARLISGNNENPKPVKDSELAKARRGPLVGIPGAPASIPGALTGDDTIWTVCDVATPPPSSTVTTTVIAGKVTLENGNQEMPKDRYALVTVNSQMYLLYDGKRAAVDLTNPAVTRALRLEGVTPRPISMNVLNAIPEVPAIAPPPIPDAGAASPITTAGVRVGSVIKMSRADSAEYYVVLAGGVQRINEVTADLIRFSDSQGAQEIVTVAPDVIAGHPSLNLLAVQTFPDRAGKIVDVPEKSVLCSSWKPGQEKTQEHASTKLLMGSSLPLKTDQVPVVLAQADKEGPNLDTAYIPPARSAFVRSTGLGGDTGRAESLYLILDTGVRFGIGNLEAAKALGLNVEPVPAPWPIVGLLPPGPRLSKEDALVVHDGMPPDKTGLAINPSTSATQAPS